MLKEEVVSAYCASPKESRAAGASAEVVTARFTKIGTIIRAVGASAEVGTARFTEIGTSIRGAGASAEVVTARFTSRKRD